MADAPKRGGPSLVGTSSVTLYTAPTNAANYGILRSIQVTNETAGTVTFSVGVGTTNTDAAGKRLITNLSLTVGNSYQWTGFLPLLGHATTPDLIYGICNTASGVAIAVGIVETT